MSITLRQICLVAENLRPVLDDFKAIFDIDVCFVDDGVATFGLENALMPIGTDFIEVVAPTKEGTSAGRYLDRRGGDGGYMVITAAHSKEIQDEVRSRAAENNVRVAWEREHGSGNFMQLHPGDMGGSFFEVDNPKPFEPTGFWPPVGGRGWEDKVNLSRVKKINAVELQSDDPLAMAARWASISGYDLSRDDKNQPCFDFENAHIRFVEARDGRGPGLGGLDIEVADKSAILEAAKSRGREHVGDQVVICGTRFNLVSP